MNGAAIARALLRWYDRVERPLPWRTAPKDPYRVWLSEVMLQQTRIEVVHGGGYFERFVARFPTVEALARAPEGDVLHAWAGLGYYARARNLHRAAKEVALAHGGRFPSTAEGLARLPGVGRYTAGAVASIAFGERAPVVDGNVSRVLSRLACIEGDVRAPAVSQKLWALASAWVPARRPGDFNQALMELGETVCTPRSPACEACPLRRSCGALRAGKVDLLPSPRVVRARPEIAAVCGAIARDGQVLLVRRAPRGLLGGLWELPGDEVAVHHIGPRALERAIAARTGLQVRAGARLGTVRHIFTHRALTLAVFACSRPRGRLRLAPAYDEAAWLDPSRAAAEVPLSTLARRALETGTRSSSGSCRNG